MQRQRQRQRQNKAAASTHNKAQKPDRFTPLLADIRCGLGSQWMFYEECVDGILEAAAQQQDTTAWFEQMQRLVGDNDKVRLSHEGLLFLLRDMGVHLHEQQAWSESHVHRSKYHSPPLSLTPNFMESALPPTNNANHPEMHATSKKSFVYAHRPLRPNTPAHAQPSVSRAQPSSTPKQQPQQRQPQILRNEILPFDFSAPVQPGLTFPEDLRAFHCPPDQIFRSADSPPNPLLPTSTNPIFFSDPAMREDAAKLFGCPMELEIGSCDGAGNSDGSSDIRQVYQIPAYEPEHDDLRAWVAKLKSSEKIDSREVKAKGQTVATWPVWNYRLDLEM